MRNPVLAVFFLLPFAALILPASPGFSDPYIESLIFVPREPQVGSSLKVEISISGNAGLAGTGELTVRTDRNRDRAFQDNEITKNDFSFKDNGPNDEESRPNLIRLTVFQIPREDLHQEYGAMVKVGPSVRTTSLIKPAIQATVATTQSGGLLSTLFSFPSALADKISQAKKALLERSPDTGAPTFAGAPNLCVYSLTNESLEKLAQSNVHTYRSPKWSMNSKTLTFVVVDRDKRKIAWIDLDKKQEIILTDGPDDHSPHWLPDNDHIIFLRGGKFHVINKDTKMLKAIESPVGVSNILGVVGDGRLARVIYSTTNQEMPDESPIYMLELDQNLRPGKRSRMIYSPNWFLIGWTSRDSSEVLWWKDAAIYKVPVNQIIASDDRKLIKDGNKHYDPAWSPDGTRIAFVSNFQ